MLLAPVVTAAVWTWTKRVYPEDAPVAKRSDSAPSDPVRLDLVCLQHDVQAHSYLHLHRLATATCSSRGL